MNEYIDSTVSNLDEFEIDPDTGIVTRYLGDDENVIIPSYIRVDNGDGTTTAIRVTGLGEGAFENNTSIKSVKLSDNITSIPQSTFSGCTNLREVAAQKVTTIGDYAFQGCISLNDYTVSEAVTSVGVDAFKDINKLTVVAGNVPVAIAAVESGARNIVVNIAGIQEGLQDTKFEVPSNVEKIEFNGYGKTYSNLRIISNATETVINQVNITNASSPALKILSSKATLNRVSVVSSTWAMMLGAETTEISLFGTIQLQNDGDENALLCKNISLKRQNAGVIGKLNVSGNMLICGTIENESLITYTSKSTITEERFNALWNNSWSDWSDWSETVVEANSDREVETKVQYRYADKQTTSSTSSSLSGWTQTGSSTSYGAWGGWSPWQTAGVAGSDTREVQTATVYPYYYFYCTHCGLGARYPYWGSSRRCEICGLTGYIINETGTVDWFTSPWSNSVQWGSDSSKHYQILHDHRIGDAIYWNWTDGGAATGYSYRDRSKTVTYSFERWGNWSDWSETVYSSSSTRKVETRTLYRSRVRQ